MLSRYSRCGKYINMLVYLCNTLFPMRHKISLLTIAFFFCYSVPALTVASATNQSPGGLRGRLTRPHCHLRMTSQCSGSLRGAPSGDCNIPWAWKRMPIWRQHPFSLWKRMSPVAGDWGTLFLPSDYPYGFVCHETYEFSSRRVAKCLIYLRLKDFLSGCMSFLWLCARHKAIWNLAACVCTWSLTHARLLNEPA